MIMNVIRESETETEGIFNQMLNLVIVKIGGTLDNETSLKEWLMNFTDKEIILNYK